MATTFLQHILERINLFAELLFPNEANSSPYSSQFIEATCFFSYLAEFSDIQLVASSLYQIYDIPFILLSIADSNPQNMFLSIVNQFFLKISKSPYCEQIISSQCIEIIKEWIMLNAVAEAKLKFCFGMGI